MASAWWPTRRGTGHTESTGRFSRTATYTVGLIVTDANGLTSSASAPVQATAPVHVGLVNGTTKRWNSPSNPAIHYWSADVTIAVHGANEQPISGATVSAAWTGALTRSVSCVTGATGRCTFKSGTLSMLRSWVTLTVTNVSVRNGTYRASANHGLVGNSAGTAVGYIKP
jgi:hypothetical protein